MKSQWIKFLAFRSIAAGVFLATTCFPDLGDSVTLEDKPGDTLSFPQDATVTTLITTPRTIEGLSGDNHGNLYTAGAGTPPCPVWQINLHKPSLTPVGFITGNCDPLGIAFNESGDLFVANGGGVTLPVPEAAQTIHTFTPSVENPPTADVFASGVPGANSIAFDKKGNLWVSDGITGQGRTWKITGLGANCTSTPAVNCEEVFRVQPMANEVNLDANGVGGIGRDVRTLPLGTITVTPTFRSAANNLGSLNLVANGLAFDKDGDKLFIADTARGAIWQATFDRDGNLTSKTGCDTTFTPNTLCLDNILVAHPYLEGADGIALDQAGNIWVVAVERQAVVVVTKNGKVIEVFRNPVNSAGLRNSADSVVGNNHILEGPTSPFLTGNVFCTAQSDFTGRDNSPRREGEVSGGQPQDGPTALAKISCMDQELKIPGLPLPVDSAVSRRELTNQPPGAS